MTKLKLLFSICVALFVMSIGWWVSSENDQLVTPQFAGFSFGGLNLGTWLFMMLLTGVVIGYLISSLGYWRQRMKASGLQRKLANKEQELAKLKLSAGKSVISRD
ncbi:lipopolysaccharide assembly protein LapA domain-containing protein [Aurantivibrio plasticivorans]